MREEILAALSQYGSPVLFTVVLLASTGIPLPVTVILIVVGSLVAQGSMNLWWAIAVASAGSVIGDQIGYAIGRWGGDALVHRFGGVLGGQKWIERAEETGRRWGGPGIYFTRWLFSALGPVVNLVSGVARYSWARFLVWDVFGEVTGVVIYVLVGRTFSDSVLALEGLLNDLTWGLLALLAVVVIGWGLIRSRRAI